MNLSISNIAWSAEYDEEMYGFLKQSGFSGLEIAPTRIFSQAPYSQLEEARQWAKRLKDKYELVVPSMQSIWYGRAEKIFGTEAERQALINYTKQAIDFAESIGCRNLVFGNPKNRDTEDPETAYPIAIEFFKEIGEYAAKHHAVIAIEPNPTIYNTHFINYTEQAVDLVRNIGSNGVKVNVDLGTILYNEESLDYLREIPEFISHVHISEPSLNLIQQRPLHNSLFSLLHSIDYDRFVSIEMANKQDIVKVKEIINYIKGISLS